MDAKRPGTSFSIECACFLSMPFRYRLGYDPLLALDALASEFVRTNRVQGRSLHQRLLLGAIELRQ